MIPKEDNPSASDYRPITCLKTLYKLIMSVIDCFLQSREEKTMGCVDNLLIKKIVLEHVHYQKKNLSCIWVDVKKASDLVSHWWAIKTFEMQLEYTMA